MMNSSLLLVDNQQALEMMMKNATSNHTVENATKNGFAEEFMPMSTEDMFFILNARLFIYGYVVLPLALVGLALNLFTILVLMHPKMRYFSTNAYLTTLSMANIICLINFVFLYSLRYLLAYDLHYVTFFFHLHLNNY